MSSLVDAVVSIALTRRKRFAWAVWASRAPQREPFVPPELHGGAARSVEQAHAEAERSYGGALRRIEPSWAKAWHRVLIGEAPWPARSVERERPARPAPAAGATETEPPQSLWQRLGVTSGVSELELKRAFRARSLQLHPDRGGSESAFRQLVRDYEEAQHRLSRRSGRRAR